MDTGVALVALLRDSHYTPCSKLQVPGRGWEKGCSQTASQDYTDDLGVMNSVESLAKITEEVIEHLIEHNIGTSENRLYEFRTLAADSGLRDLILIDETIPGFQHNINENGDRRHYAVARIEDRPIFRPIQYVGSYLRHGSLEWLTRSIVTMSCTPCGEQPQATTRD